MKKFYNLGAWSAGFFHTDFHAVFLSIVVHLGHHQLQQCCQFHSYTNKLYIICSYSRNQLLLFLQWGLSGWVESEGLHVRAVLCPWARHINPCLVLVQPKKTCLDITEKLLTGTLRIKSSKTNYFFIKIFYWPFQGGTSFVDLLCFCSVLCLLCFVHVCLYVLCGHLLGKGWPLGSRLWCLLWVCHFPIGILGQVWYLIVSIPDLCTITYFYTWTKSISNLTVLFLYSWKYKSLKGFVVDAYVPLFVAHLTWRLRVSYCDRSIVIGLWPASIVGAPVVRKLFL